MRLKDKIALVTGSSRGVGRAVAVAYAREGAKVMINYTSNEKAAKEPRLKIGYKSSRPLPVTARRERA